MNRALLFHPAGRISGPLLADALAIPAVRHSKADTIPEGADLIRWGSAAAVNQPARQHNSRASLSRYKNRLQHLETMRDGEVPLPPFGTYPGEFMDAEGDILARDFAHGRQNSHGRGITIYSYNNVLPGHDMYMALMPKDRQFRVHVMLTGEETQNTRTRELVPSGPNPEQQRSVPVWNLATGFTYRVVQGERPKGVIPAAVRAVRALGLDFGAVDVIWSEEYGASVLEVNSAPGLGEATLEWYAEQFSARFQEGV